MARRHVLAVLAVLAVFALSAPTAATAKTFYGTVGPTMTITLKRANGKVVHRIGAGTHTFVIRDRSSMHNFHLLGPGIDRRRVSPSPAAAHGPSPWAPGRTGTAATPTG
jgi:hypothetical protein